MPITVTSLHIYPVKSLRGLSLARTVVLPHGFVGDRRWMLTDTGGCFLTQREVRDLASIEARITTAGLELCHADAGAISVVEPDAGAPLATVTVWRHTGPARRAAPKSEAWLSRVLGRAVHLVFMHDPTSRPVSPDYGRAGDHVSFADGYPVLVTNTASLDAIIAAGSGTHTMRQFRPSLVVTGAPAWAEDSWQVIRIGAVTLRIVKPCERCVVTTLDPDSGHQLSETEPLRTLGRIHRGADGRILFGQNAIPEGIGTIAVGDVVEVLQQSRSA